MPKTLNEHGLQAMAYVWGRQDERGERDSDSTDGVTSFEFAHAYSEHAADYDAERIHYRVNIPRAYNQFVCYGYIDS